MVDSDDKKDKSNGDIDPTASMSVDLGKLLQDRERLEEKIQKKFRKVITVLFTDMKGSTALAEEEGNLAARLLIKQHNDIVLPTIAENNGVLVKTMGDGTLSWFASAQDAVRAGVRIQAAVDKYNRTKSPKIPIQVRVGMHTGEGLVEKTDIFGDVVNVASRFESQAEVGEVCLSEETHNSMSDKDEFRCRFVRMAALKGKKEEFKVFKAFWKPEEIEAEKSQPLAITVEEEGQSKDTSSVFKPIQDIRFAQSSRQVAAETLRMLPTIVMEESGRPTQVIQLVKDVTSIGRSLDSDIVLEDTYCSRRHAQIITEDSECHIEDLESKIGVSVNGERVSRQKLHSGDEIMIGEIRLTFVEPRRAEATAAAAEADATMVMGYKPGHKLVVRTSQSTIGEYLLTDEPKIIGRADTMDIFLNDNVISRRHAKIWEKDGKVFLEDLGSHNGTFVDGRQLSAGEQVELNEKSKGRLGTFSMVILNATQKADISLFEEEHRTIMDKMKGLWDKGKK